MNQFILFKFIGLTRFIKTYAFTKLAAFNKKEKNMKSKRLTKILGGGGVFILIAVLLLSISLVACSSAPVTTTVTSTSVQATTTTSAVTKTATSTATSVIKVVTLKFAPGGSPNDKALFGGIPEWAKAVESRTEGRVKIDVYYGETLAKGRENIDALQSGLADVVFPAPHHQPGKLPLFTLGNVPGLSYDGWAKNRAFYELMITQQAMTDEFAKYNGICIGSAYYANCGILSPVAVKTVAQMNGMKISAMNPASDIIKAFGAAPLSITPAEQYEGIMRKTVDALAEPIAASVDFKHYEVAKFFTWFNLGDRNHTLLISKAAMDKLSAADQKIIKDLAADYVVMAYNSAMNGLEPRGVDILKNAGVTFIDPSAEDQAKCLAESNKLADVWVTEMNGKGLPGTALMAKYKELIKKYEAVSPYKK
jgi:TRAP-type transport system periplasmic protein